MAIISILNQLADLIKKRASRSILISKTDLGNRDLYLYQLPSGEMKEVFHKKSIKQRKPKAIPLAEQAPMPKREKAEDAPNKKRMKKPEEAHIKRTKKVEPTKWGHMKKPKPVEIEDTSEFKLLREEDCRSPLPLKWQILEDEKSNRQVHLLEGQKFTIEVSDFKSSPKRDIISFVVHVQNIQRDVTVYRQRLEFPVKEFIRDPEQFLPEISFLTNQERIQKIAHWITVEKINDLKAVVHGIEYALEVTYFTTA